MAPAGSHLPVGPGEADLDALLAALAPQMLPGVYVFCTLPGAALSDIVPLEPLATCHETEGLSLVLEKARADRAGLDYHGEFRCITLTVHSSLAAVGLTAAVAGALAGAGVSANVIAACRHDHVLVPVADAGTALAALARLATGAQR